jgi:hypothetical protein
MCMLRTLHEPAASVQQPPTERLPMPELAEKGSAKALQLHCQWGGLGGLVHWGQGGRCPGSPLGPCMLFPDEPCVASLSHGNSGYTRGLHASKALFSSPCSGDQRKNFLKVGGVPPLVTKVPCLTNLPSSYL